MISINNSFLNLKLQNSIFKNIKSLSTSLQRMMSGLKINTPADDPAGFYVSNKLSTQIRGLESANSNIQTALNLLGIADTSVSEINTIMEEVRDLVSKSTSEYLTPQEREENQKKINSLFSQALQIKDAANYNGNKLFSNTAKLDKNQTYYNDKSTTTGQEPVAMYNGRSYNVATTAAGMTLNQLSEPEEINSPSPSSNTEPASEPIAMMAYSPRSLSAGTPENSGEDLNAGIALMSFAPEEGDLVTTSIEEEEETPAANQVSMMSMARGIPAEPDYQETLNQNETKTIEIAGKLYDVTNTGDNGNTLTYNTNQSGAIVFGGSNFDIQAHSGQDDNIILEGWYINTSLGTGDGNDNVTIATGYCGQAWIDLGAGNDALTAEENINNYGNVFFGGNDNDTFIDKSNLTDAELYQFESDIVVKNIGSSGTYTFAAGETATVMINGMTYTITNNSNSNTQTLTYSTDANNQITLKANYQESYTVTAANNQVDNIKLAGGEFEFYAGNMDDTIIAGAPDTAWYGSNVVIHGGDGNDNITMQATTGIAYGEAGNDTITLSSGSCQLGDTQSAYGGDGDDTITVNDTYTDVLDGGSGTNTLFNTSGSSVNSTNFASTNQVENLGTSGSRTFAAGETATVQIDGKIYTVTNNSTTNSQTLTYATDAERQITFTSNAYESFSITAADGQNDNINFHVHEGTLNTGDGDDYVILATNGITLNTGAGNDTIVTTSDTIQATVDGGDGVDNYIDNHSSYNITTNNVEITKEIVESGTIELATDEAKEVTINGLTYTIRNQSFNNNTANIEYTVDTDGLITFIANDASCMQSITIVAADGQNDKIALAATESGNGTKFTLYTQDGDDSVYLSSAGAIVNLGTGNNYHEETYSSQNTITNNSIEILGTEGTVDLAVGETKDIMVNNKIYTVTNNTSGQTVQLLYSLKDGKVLFSGKCVDSDRSAQISINAESGQHDTIELANAYFGLGASFTINTNDGNDTVYISSYGSSSINLGDGNDTAIVSSNGYNIIDGGYGSDTIIENKEWVDQISNSTYTNFEHGNGTAEAHSKELSAGETATITIAGKTYNVTNGSTAQTLNYHTDIDGVVYFHTTMCSEIEITAAENQQDVVSIAGGNITFNAGDSDDTVYLSSQGASANLGDGNDEAIINYDGSYRYNIIDGGSGSDSVTDNYNAELSADTVVSNIEYVNGEEYTTTSGTIEIARGETKTININGKKYDVTNSDSQTRTLTYNLEDSGEITFDGNWLTITAHDGQEDNIILNGTHMTVYTGDEDDTIEIKGHKNIVNLGAGNDTIKLENYSYYDNTIYGGEGEDIAYSSYLWDNHSDIEKIIATSNSSSFRIFANQTVILEIDNKQYTINNTNESPAYVSYSLDDESKINITSNSPISITASDGQDDVVNLISAGIIFNAGDGNDTVYLSSQGATVNLGDGNDEAIINYDGNYRYNIIDGGSGSDSVTDNYNAELSADTVVSNIEYVNGEEYTTTSGTIEIAAGETATVQIDGKIYTVTNNSTTNAQTLTYATDAERQITFTSNAYESFSITAADGQNDNINFHVHEGTLNTGDGDDYVILATNGITLNTGAGNDTIVTTSDTIQATVDGGDGVDAIYIEAGATITLDIKGKKYDVTNNSSDSTLTYTLDENKAITFTGDYLTITAHDGQEDNIILKGTHLSVYTGDGDDNVTSTSSVGSSIIDLGSGTDTFTDENSDMFVTSDSQNIYKNAENGSITSSAEVELTSGQTTTIEIDGKKYDVTNNKNFRTSFVLGYHPTGTTFNGSHLTLTAHDGQDDTLVLDGIHMTVYTGDGDDNIALNNQDNTIDLGAGDDTIKLASSDRNTVDGGDGIDRLIITTYGIALNATNFESLTIRSNETQTIDINGKKYDITNSSNSTQTLTYSIDENDAITFDGSLLTITAHENQEDNIILNGDRISLNTGNLNDIVTANSTGGVINLGDGDDIITNYETTTLDGGAGNDTIVDHSSKTIFENFEDITVNNRELTLGKGLSTVIDINGLQYTVQAKTGFDSYATFNYSYINSDLIFDGDGFNITAKNGQTDNIIISGDNNTLNTGDGDDTITFNGGENNTISGGADNDTLYNNSSDDLIINDIENIVAGDINTISINAGSTTTININGKKYDITNSSDSTQTLTYSIDEHDAITFDGRHLTITAHDGQEDNIILEGSHLTLYTGDQADTVDVQSQDSTVNLGDDNDVVSIQSSNVSISLGAGDDIVYDNGANTNPYVNGGDGFDVVYSSSLGHALNDVEKIVATKNEGKFEVSSGQSIIFEIDGKQYTVENTSEYDSDFNYSLKNDGKLSLTTGYHGGIIVTATGDQDDYIEFNGINSTLNTGDGDDVIYVTSHGTTINSGSGNDTVHVLSSNNIIDLGDDNDEVILNNSSSNNTIHGGNGTDSFIDANTHPTTYYYDFENGTGNANIAIQIGQTITVNIDGKLYDISKTGGEQTSIIRYQTSTDGKILIEEITDASHITITAHDGQNDNIELGMHMSNITLDTGDENDIVIVSGDNNTLIGGDGIDNLHDYGSNNISSEFENSEITLTKGETKTIEIDGKKYDVTNSSDSTQTLTYSIDEHDAITFDGDWLTITAHENQEDNIILKGYHMSLYTGDENDTVLGNTSSGYINLGDGDDIITFTDNLAQYTQNSVDGGSGNDTFIDANTHPTMYNNSFSNFENGNSIYSSINLKDGQSITLDIGGKKYDVTKNGGEHENASITYSISQDGKILIAGFHADGTTITAHDGQNDNIELGMHMSNVTLDTGDENDIVTVFGDNNTLIGGDGIDNLHDYGSNNISSEFENSGLTINSGETKTIEIDGKKYDITNSSGSTKTLNYDINSNKEITFEGENLSITAHNGQEDNIILKGSNLTLDTGDSNDNVVNTNTGSSNSILLGTGDDTVENFQWGSYITGNAGNDSIKVYGNNTEIFNNSYTSGTDNIFIYGDNNNFTEDYGNVGSANTSNNITVDGKNNNITVNENDKITINGTNNTIDAKNSSGIVINGNRNTIYADSSTNPNSVVINSNNNILTTGSGNDNITIKGNSNTVNANSGNDSINITGTGNTVYGGAGSDTTTLSGKDNTYFAEAGDDYTIIQGSGNTANGGTGYDKVENGGINTTYSSMDELANATQKYNIQVGGDFTNHSKYEISTDAFLPNIKIDVSTSQKAIESLTQIDEIMQSLTSTRVDLKFQQDMLNSIMKTNLTRITNLSNSRSTLIDADVATEYNKLLEQAAKLQSVQLLQTQLQQKHSSTIMNLINSIAS